MQDLELMSVWGSQSGRDWQDVGAFGLHVVLRAQTVTGKESKKNYVNTKVLGHRNEASVICKDLHPNDWCVLLMSFMILYDPKSCRLWRGC